MSVDFDARSVIAGRTIVVTGGTGTFGSAAVERFSRHGAKEIRIFSRDEKKQDDLRRQWADKPVRFFIGDVRDRNTLTPVMQDADYVFHAAALKQVPSCEFYPIEAVRTNLFGAENVMAASIENGVERVVVLSTDKAVYPINAMGMSKALMEKAMVARARLQNEGETVLCATRYGNVMASRGSVIPHFIDQLKKGCPLTVTDPNMTRFLMSLDDSVDLVLHAYAHGKQGDIFVQKAPASTMGDLAQAVKEIFRKDNPIQIIGTRHGEKLYESLVSREEMARVQDLDRYFRIPADTRDLNYSKYFSVGEEKISRLDDYTSHNTERLDVGQVKKLLLELDYVQAELRS